MIDINKEQLIPLRCVPGRLPLQANGRRVNLSSVYRWILRGIRGVKLESIRIGGHTYTSDLAIQRWAEKLTAPQTLMAPRQAPVVRNRADVSDRVAAELGIRKEVRS